MAGLKIRRNDKVQVIAGKDRGKQGRVLRVMQDENRLLVEHVMMIKKTVKPNPQRNIKGGDRGTGKPHPHFQRDVGLRQLRAGSGGFQV